MRVYNKHPGTVEGVGAGQFGNISERAYKRAPWAFSIEPAADPDQNGRSSESSGETGAQNSAGSGGKSAPAAQ